MSRWSFFTSLLFILFYFNLHSQTDLSKDSLYVKARRLAVSGGEEAEAQAVPLLQKCAQLCKSEGDSLLEAKCYHIISNCILNSNTDSSLIYRDKAIALYKFTDRKLYFDCLAYKGYIYTDNGRYDEAIEIYNQCLKGQKDEPAAVAKIYSEIGYVYDRMKSYEKAIEYNRLALKYANDEEGFGKAYGMIGIAYDELEQYDSAMFYNEKALEQFRKGEIYSLESVWLSNTGNTLIKLQKYDLALDRFWRADSINQLTKYQSTILYTNIGRALMESGRMKEAKDYLEKSLSLARAGYNKRAEEEAEFMLSQWFEKSGLFQDALVHFKLHTSIKDSIYKLEKLREADELQLRYETASKNRLIAEKELEIERKNTEVQQSNFRNILLGIMALALAILAFAVFRVQVQKRKRLRAESEQKMTEQKLSISKELHDNIGSQITFIIHSLENAAFVTTSEKLKSILVQLSEHGREALDDLRNTVWVMKQAHGTSEQLVAKFLEIKSRVYSIEIDVQNNAESVQLTSVQLLNLFRIGQEAIQNAVKYSGASRIEVNIEMNDKVLYLTISDFGKGFKTNVRTDGNGLIHMKERAEAINAFFEIFSNEKGTKVQVRLNLS